MAPRKAPAKKEKKTTKEAPPVVDKKRKAPEESAPAAKKAKVEKPVEVPNPVNALSPVVDVMVLGSGEVGQLGLGKTLGRKRPTVVPEVANKRVLKLDVGGLHNGVLVQVNESDPTETQLFTWGCNDNKILGRETPATKDEDDEDISMKPGVVSALNGKHVVDVDSGEYHMVALTRDGKLYSWGTFKDDEGFLGYSSEQRREEEEPRIFPGLEDKIIKQVASAHNHTICLTDKGEVLIWGFDWMGRKVSDRLKREHLRPKPVVLPRKGKKAAPKITMVAAGGYHNFVRTQNDEIWAWGLNNHGQLGVGEDKKTGKLENVGAPVLVEGLSGKHIIQIAAGQHHTIALSSDGTVWAFGKGEYGQLGIDKPTEGAGGKKIPPPARHTPAAIPFFSNLPNGDKVIQISSTDNHCTAVTRDGKCYAWGFGERGQIGNAMADDEGSDANTPFEIQGPQLRERKVAYAGAGGQHTALLAFPKEEA